MSDEKEPTCQCCHGVRCEIHDEIETPANFNEALKFVSAVSARAQRLAYDEQEEEFKLALREKVKALRCIGCGKELEYTQWGEETESGYFYEGGLIIDTMGYGSTQHDMSKIAILVCDDCVTQKGIVVDWMNKLHAHFEVEVKKPLEPDGLPGNG